MSRVSAQMRDFAERLIDYESREKRSSGIKTPAACLASEKLGLHLAIPMGNVGSRALLARALVLASTEVRWLRAVHVTSDGSFEGLNELGAQVDPDEFFEGCVVLLAQLLRLMMVLIGEVLTLRLVSEVWPTLSLNNLDVGKGGKK